MSATVFALVLLAAALHAGWNAVVKSGQDKLLATTLVTGGAALIAAAALPFVAAPAASSWPWLGVSVVLQVLYYVLVALAYRSTDMGVAYPLMRGSAPLLVALAAGAAFGERLAPFAWAGIALLCGGILGMVHGHRSRRLVLPLLNAAVIALYTLVDAAGARRSGSPVGYALWLFLLSGLPLPLWALVRHRAALAGFARDDWRQGLLGGLGTVTAYAIALWAMTRAPVAMVAALRETSILFGMLIATAFLHERPTRARLVAGTLIAAGAVMLRLA